MALNGVRTDFVTGGIRASIKMAIVKLGPM